MRNPSTADERPIRDVWKVHCHVMKLCKTIPGKIRAKTAMSGKKRKASEVAKLSLSKIKFLCSVDKDKYDSHCFCLSSPLISTCNQNSYQVFAQGCISTIYRQSHIHEHIMIYFTRSQRDHRSHITLSLVTLSPAGGP